MKIHALSAVLLAGAIALVGLAAPPETKAKYDAVVSVHFSPNGGCTEEIVAQLGRAKDDVLVLAYQFTSEPIATALIAAEKRGVQVRIIADRTQQKDKDSWLPKCKRAGAECFIDAAHAIQHNKVIVIDGETVITGSFNFSGSAEKRNAENLVTIRSEELAKQYHENFIKHLEHSKAFK